MVGRAVSWEELGPKSGGLSLLVGSLWGPRASGQSSWPIARGVASVGRGDFGGPPYLRAHPEALEGIAEEASCEGLQRDKAAHTQLRSAVPLCKGASVLTMHVHDDACVLK